VVETYDALHCGYGSYDRRCGYDDVVGCDVLGWVCDEDWESGDGVEMDYGVFREDLGICGGQGIYVWVMVVEQVHGASTQGQL